jgi:glycosyltransferase involved in cell wall biosynthesis
MVSAASLSTTAPYFSVIIAIYNDWAPLHHCLQSIAEQTDAPNFEVIVVDDGSREIAPPFIESYGEAFALTLVRQRHLGVAAARNCGAKIAKGPVLVFVDADCKLEPNCLSALGSTIADSPDHQSFQLRLTGDCSGLVGRAEELRLIALQAQMLQPNGCIRYLNTAGFAIRRENVNVEAGVFDPAALRSEDTLLLANLMQHGELPLFVANATVQHAISLSLMRCFLKDVRSAWLEAKTNHLIASKGVRIGTNRRERLAMVLSMWKSSRRHSIGRLAWLVVLAREGLGRLLFVACSRLGVHTSSHALVAF